MLAVFRREPSSISAVDAVHTPSSAFEGDFQRLEVERGREAVSKVSDGGVEAGATRRL